MISRQRQAIKWRRIYRGAKWRSILTPNLTADEWRPFQSKKQNYFKQILLHCQAYAHF